MPLLSANSSATSSALYLLSPDVNPGDTLSIAASTSLSVNCEASPVSPSPLTIYSRSTTGSPFVTLDSFSGFASSAFG